MKRVDFKLGKYLREGGDIFFNRRTQTYRIASRPCNSVRKDPKTKEWIPSYRVGFDTVIYKSRYIGKDRDELQEFYVKIDSKVREVDILEFIRWCDEYIGNINDKRHEKVIILE